MRFLLLGLILPQITLGQVKSKLNKHTYFVMTFHENLFTGWTGSGFFIRDNGKTFFLTNYHVLTGREGKGETTHEVDFIKVSAETSHNTVCTISSKRDTAFERKIDYYDMPDLVCIEVFPNEDINDISSLIDTSFFSKMPQTLYMYGFPSEYINQDTHKPKGYPTAAPFSKYDSLFMLKRTKYRPPGMADTMFLRKYEEMTFMVRNMEAKPGMSGSPIFGEYKIGTKRVIKFVGVLTISARNETYAGIIPALQVMKLLKEVQYKDYP